jgi:oligopeptide/dipeptide ABC transporter ATP-binding protein
MQNSMLLEVKDLKTHFFLDEGIVKAVDGVDLAIKRGATLGVVGESGCGKSVTAFSILQLVQKPGHIVAGQVLLQRVANSGKKRNGNRNRAGRPEVLDLAKLKSQDPVLRTIRGGEIGMIFQEPMTSLSMMHTVGFQIIEAIRLHRNVTDEEAREQAISMLGRVGIPKPEKWVDAYPFQLSGGMRQRAMIAMALSCNPSLLIADEPTTALDVTTQAQILELMVELQQDFGMAVMLITHDLGVIAETCDHVAVMYLGEVVEQADVDAIFHNPSHPYTQALLKSIPRLGQSKQGRLDPIAGSVPDPYNRPSGCSFHPRCPRMMPGKCDAIHPPRTKLSDERAVRCLLYGGEK